MHSSGKELESIISEEDPTAQDGQQEGADSYIFFNPTCVEAHTHTNAAVHT